MKYINLTHHNSINIYRQNGMGRAEYVLTIRASGSVLRCDEDYRRVFIDGGVPIPFLNIASVKTVNLSYPLIGATKIYNFVAEPLSISEELPPMINGTWYVVSRPVRIANAHRLDFVSPGPKVFDSTGSLIGMMGLVANCDRPAFEPAKGQQYHLTKN